jgi:hypothetical protein
MDGGLRSRFGRRYLIDEIMKMMNEQRTSNVKANAFVRSPMSPDQKFMMEIKESEFSITRHI